LPGPADVVESQLMRIAFYGDSITSGRPGSSYFTLLQKSLPQHALINLGKGNETVPSLYRRIVRRQLGIPVDLAFLWIGVNDVPWRDWWGQRAFSRIVGQPRAKDLDEFERCYKATLGLLCESAGQVVTVPPLLRGEQPDNHWNPRLGTLAQSIEHLTGTCERASYLDLRPLFLCKLAKMPVSDYYPKSPLRVGADILTLGNDEKVMRKASQRGLHFTLDGLHLNPAGAKLVADRFQQVIEQQVAGPAGGSRHPVLKQAQLSSAGDCLGAAVNT